jgi:hypothetical protein
LNPRKALGGAVVEAYVLIQTEIGKPPQVAAELGFIPGVATADILAGPYDVIVRVEAADVDALGKLVVTKIQDVEGVTRTLTCPWSISREGLEPSPRCRSNGHSHPEAVAPTQISLSNGPRVVDCIPRRVSRYEETGPHRCLE